MYLKDPQCMICEYNEIEDTEYISVKIDES